MAIKTAAGFGFASQLAFGALAISLMPTAVRASAEVDRKYALETVGVLRSWDNVDGLFADYVAQAYKEFFSHQTRFRLQDLSKADELITHSHQPYPRAIEDNEILGSLSRALKAQSIIRTRIFKEGPRYRFVIDWMHSPNMDVLANETFNLQDSGANPSGAISDGSQAHDFAGLGDIKGQLQTALTRMFAKVPFMGQVTGRDKNDITVNLGAASDLHRGDTLILGTIEEVRKHPLLKEIVEWRISQTGRAEVDSVDEALSFCHVVDQEEGREISRFQKILKIIPKPEKLPKSEIPIDARPNLIDEPPKVGFAMASLWMGSYSRQFSSLNGTIGKQGSGLLFGARGTGELWLNREIFADIEVGYASFGYTQSDIATGAASAAGSVSGSLFTIGLNLGYTYLLTGDFFGPRAWVKLGYIGDSYSLPISVTEATSPYSLKSAYLGLGGDFPIRDGYGARVDLKFGFLNGGGETGELNGSINSSHNASISISGYYRFKQRVHFSAAIEIQGTGSEFASEASLSQKTITLLPSVQYFF